MPTRSRLTTSAVRARPSPGRPSSPTHRSPRRPPSRRSPDPAGHLPVAEFGSPLIFDEPVAYFTDANPAPRRLVNDRDFTATIDWGDGTPPSAGTITQPGGPNTMYVVTGSHTYASTGPNGTYPIQVFVVDTAARRLTINNTATVTAPTITVTGMLNPASDSGKSNTDDITNVTQPNFYRYGHAEFSHHPLRNSVRRWYDRCDRQPRPASATAPGRSLQRPWLRALIRSPPVRPINSACTHRSRHDYAQAGHRHHPAGDHRPQLRPVRRHVDRDLPGQPEWDGLAEHHQLGVLSHLGQAVGERCARSEDDLAHPDLVHARCRYPPIRWWSPSCSTRAMRSVAASTR